MQHNLITSWSRQSDVGIFFVIDKKHLIGGFNIDIGLNNLSFESRFCSAWLAENLIDAPYTKNGFIVRLVCKKLL